MYSLSQLRPAFVVRQMVNLLLFFTSLQGQAKIGSRNGVEHLQPKIIDARPGVLGNIRVMRDGNTLQDVVDLTEELRLIVEFKEEPHFIQLMKQRSSTLQRSSVFARFSADLQEVAAQARSDLKLDLPQPAMRRLYQNVFYGAAITVPRAIVGQIESLPYVRKVHTDEPVHATLDQSIHVIGADSVWSAYGAQGEGVRIGILDTGIDYMHPSLGGAPFPNLKVLGGYDFENDDADPIDDNGHGTHVAGIVSANGADIKGVAPAGKLLAIKVLDANGSGFFSAVISGLEFASDPNKDGNPDDHLDIVNMSLGGAGDPDDALSIASDNASRMGIIVCASAGNSEQKKFRSIGSPGASRRAITVGASDNLDQIAHFNSKGPSRRSYSIKPDIVAPGVAIRSTVLNGRFEYNSGTSMASPHVAGLCALMKNVHPSWSVEKIKSAVTTTARDLGFEVMIQGTGRIDAWRAARMNSAVVPSNLSFGLDSSNHSAWTKADTLWLYNLSSIEQTYAGALGTLPSGVSISLDPALCTIASGDSQRVTVDLQVDNAVVSYPDSGSLAYDGILVFEGTVDTMRVPWAFVKASRILFRYDRPPFFDVSNPKFLATISDAEFVGDNYAEMVIPPGVYDVVFSFLRTDKPRRLVVVLREEVSLSDFSVLDINSTEAVHTIHVASTDGAGERLSSYRLSRRVYNLLYPSSSSLKQGMFFGNDDTLMVSPFSDRFTFLIGEQAYDGLKKSVLVQHQAVTGVQQNVTLSNSPADFTMQYLKLDLPPTTTEFTTTFNIMNKFESYGISYFIVPMKGTTQAWDGSWEGQLYLTKNVHPKYGFSTSFDVFCSLGIDPLQQFYLRTPPFNVLRDSVGLFRGNAVSPEIYLAPSNDTLWFGGSPVHLNVFHANNLIPGSNFYSVPDAFGPFDDLRFQNPMLYSLFDINGTPLESKSLDGSIAQNLPAGPYRLELTYSGYNVNGAPGLAMLQTRFDLRQADADPPRFSSLQLRNALRHPTGTLTRGETASLVFSAGDPLQFLDRRLHIDQRYQPLADSTRVFYRPHGAPEWISLPVSKIGEDSTYPSLVGSVYNSDLSPTTDFDSSAIDLKLQIKDLSGNSTEFILMPAYAVGKYRGVTSIGEVFTTITPVTFALYQNYPNPFNLSSTITFDVAHQTHVRLRMYDILGRLVRTLVDEEKLPGRYQAIWEGTNALNATVSSGLYFSVFEAGGYFQARKLILLK